MGQVGERQQALALQDDLPRRSEVGKELADRNKKAESVWGRKTKGKKGKENGQGERERESHSWERL